MKQVSHKHFRRAAALLSLPLIAMAPAALAQDIEAVEEQAQQAPLDEADPAGPIAPMSGPITSLLGPIDPAYGHIRTFDGAIETTYGHIRTFDGAVDPKYGHIRTFAGLLDPAYGHIRTFTDPLDPAYGHIRTFVGDLTPYVGHIRTFAGALDPAYGHIRTFEGEVDPAYGHIRTFEGDLDPYYGHIRTFWGTLTLEGGEANPAYGHIRTFSDAFLPQSDTILATWYQAEQSGDYSAVIAQLRQLEADGAALFDAASTRQTGQSFADSTSAPLFAKWGIDLAQPGSLSGLDIVERQLFLLDWHDNVTLLSGMNSPDHWMNAVNWTPKLTQAQGGGSDAVIGLVDFYAGSDADLASKTTYWGGYTHISHPHGSAVGSLIVGSHDGHGVMGIAPEAKVAAYNPFDETLTASWEDVTRGIVEVGKRGAAVINLSLGVPGSTLAADWRDVFTTKEVERQNKSTIYVLAAGNDGLVQTADIEMKGALDSTFLVVGSVNPYGHISNFSNSPGTACLTENGKCRNDAIWNEGDKAFEGSSFLKDSGLLMNRFLVAPGELILVSDGQGGVTRMSGTSFAAPLVSGAIALIHDRWPWLKKAPRDVARIVLESAQDLGAPGVDAVYGHGLLDVEASQSPLDFGELRYFLVDDGGIRPMSISRLQNGGVQPAWSTSDMYFHAFERLDQSQRDFLIPLSSRLFDSSLAGEGFQDFVYHRMVDWLGSASFTGRLTDAAPVQTMKLGNGWNLAMGSSPVTVRAGSNLRQTIDSRAALTSPDGRFAFGFGSGGGALALAGSGALALNGDFDPRLGGANPLLGFASGGAHVTTRMMLAEGLDLTLGITGQDRGIGRDQVSGLGFADSQLLLSAGNASAQATMARLGFRPAAAVNLSLAWTRLAEEGAFFGTRSLDRADFGDATISDGLTLAADADLGAGLSLFATGTASRSRSTGDAMLGIDGALGTAFQLGVAKAGLFAPADTLRLSLAQPLTVESGHAEMRMVGVIDRETGETGIVTQRVGIGAPEQRRFRAEALYGTPLLGGRGTLGIFGSAELRGATLGVPAVTVGANARIAF